LQAITDDLPLGKSVAENLTISAIGLNLAIRRFLLNSATFGGTHYEPRQIYLQVRYHFRY
jgi:hypothetical protein